MLLSNVCCPDRSMFRSSSVPPHYLIMSCCDSTLSQRYSWFLVFGPSSLNHCSLQDVFHFQSHVFCVFGCESSSYLPFAIQRNRWYVDNVIDYRPICNYKIDLGHLVKMSKSTIVSVPGIVMTRSMFKKIVYDYITMVL